MRKKSIITGIRYLYGGKLSTRLHDKRDDFDFHIVNFPFFSSNVPSSPSYGAYISQLIRYVTCCSHYDDFRYCHKCLVNRLLSQGYIALRLEKSFNPILPEGGKIRPLLFFLHHPKTAQGIKLKLSDFKDTLLRHQLQVKPVL